MRSGASSDLRLNLHSSVMPMNSPLQDSPPERFRKAKGTGDRSSVSTAKASQRLHKIETAPTSRQMRKLKKSIGEPTAAEKIGGADNNRGGVQFAGLSHNSALIEYGERRAGLRAKRQMEDHVAGLEAEVREIRLKRRENKVATIERRVRELNKALDRGTEKDDQSGSLKVRQGLIKSINNHIRRFIKSSPSDDGLIVGCQPSSSAFHLPSSRASATVTTESESSSEASTDWTSLMKGLSPRMSQQMNVFFQDVERQHRDDQSAGQSQTSGDSR